MPTLESIGRVMLIMGGLIIVGGLVFIVLGRFGLGRLPGDIFVEKERLTFYFPVVTMLIVSVVLTLLVNLILRLLR